jgi:hypothetical protein
MRPRRAFVMPLVLMLTMVLTLSAAFIIQRQNTQYTITRRHVAQYDAHHTTRGIADVIDAWLSGGGRYKSFRDRIDGEGRILEISVPDGLSARSSGPDMLRVMLEDGQGTLLSDYSGLTGQTLLDAKRALDALKAENPGDWRRFTRPMGPVTVSVVEAPREVLSAMVQGITESTLEGQGFVSSLMSARDAGPVDAAALNQAMLDAQLPPEQMAALQRVLTSETTFWKLRIDVLRGGTERVARYDGFLSSMTAARTNNPGQSRKGHVMNLRAVALDAPWGTEGRADTLTR